MILDERSLISQEIMGLIDETLHHTLHGGTKQQRRPFGGLPIVIAFGDDHQLPSIVINGSGKGAIYHFDKNRKKNMNQRKKQNNPKFVIENNMLFPEGCVIKYICRHPHKGKKEDLLKAIHFIEMIIETTNAVRKSNKTNSV